MTPYDALLARVLTAGLAVCLAMVLKQWVGAWVVVVTILLHLDTERLIRRANRERTIEAAIPAHHYGPTCPACNGHGVVDDGTHGNSGYFDDCQRCGGRGHV